MDCFLSPDACLARQPSLVGDRVFRTRRAAGHQDQVPKCRKIISVAEMTNPSALRLRQSRRDGHLDDIGESHKRIAGSTVRFCLTSPASPSRRPNAWAAAGRARSASTASPSTASRPDARPRPIRCDGFTSAAPVDLAKWLMVTTVTGTRPAVDQRSALQRFAPRFV